MPTGEKVGLIAGLVGVVSVALVVLLSLVDAPSAVFPPLVGLAVLGTVGGLILYVACKVTESG